MSCTTQAITLTYLYPANSYIILCENTKSHISLEMVNLIGIDESVCTLKAPSLLHQSKKEGTGGGGWSNNYNYKCWLSNFISTPLLNFSQVSLGPTRSQHCRWVWTPQNATVHPKNACYHYWGS